MVYFHNEFPPKIRVKLFQKSGLYHLIHENREFFKDLPIRRLTPNDYHKFPPNKVNWFSKKETIKAEFHKQIKKNIQHRLIGKTENVLAIISEQFGDGMEYNNNLYLVLAPDKHENKNPLIIGILYNVVVMNDKGIINEINNEYHNYTHYIFMLIKICATT